MKHRILFIALLAFASLGCAQDHSRRAYELRSIYNEVLADSSALHDAKVITDDTYSTIISSGEFVSPLLDELDRIADAEAAAKASGKPVDETTLAFNFEKVWTDVRPKVIALVIEIAASKQKTKGAMVWPMHNPYWRLSRAA